MSCAKLEEPQAPGTNQMMTWYLATTYLGTPDDCGVEDQN